MKVINQDLKTTKIEPKKDRKISRTKDGFLDATCEISGLIKNKRYDCLDGGGTF